MKGLKNFKVLFRYFKNDKLLLSTYIIFTVLKFFESLVNAFVWANAFQALSEGNTGGFVKYLILWSSIIIIAWVIIQLPTSLIYNKLEKKFMENVSKDLYAKVTDLPAIAFEDIGVGEYINRMYTYPDRILELLQ